MKLQIKYSPEVSEALSAGAPVVALESTLIAHGFPYPDNRDLALELEDILRSDGVVPATVAIIDGRVTVGLTPDQLERIASDAGMIKASVRDIPVLVGTGRTGATTVASTMQIAYWAGIHVFVTGGIGGVHRYAEETFDISADLWTLSRCPITVVCAGAKSVLDLPRTVEVLETLGVPVLGYGTDRFPAFYLRDSGIPLDYSVGTPEEVARVIEARDRMKFRSAVVVAVPIPEQHELDPAEFQQVLDEVMAELRNNHITGKAVTPYLLKHLHERSGGKTVRANTELIKNNLRVGSAIARARRIEA
jgi:pseudouridylate synthase